jgi:radical SAM-linked protein
MTQTSQPTLKRIRLHYRRGEELRYVAHLDMQQVWERTLRRARLPVAYSQGFSPRPRLHLASALPLGFLSRCEIMDVWLLCLPEAEALAPEEVGAKAQAAAPPGLAIYLAEEASLAAPALQTQVISAEYLAEALDDVSHEQLLTAVENLLALQSLVRERRGKQYDLRPLVESLEVHTDGEIPVLWMRLTARESATGRPEELMSALGFDPADFRITRLSLVLDDPLRQQA